jgi:hypothetical protein
LLETTRLTLASEVLSRTLTGKWDQERLVLEGAEWDNILKESGFSGVDISLKDVSILSLPLSVFY